jgi:hypothetical protein
MRSKRLAQMFMSLSNHFSRPDIKLLDVEYERIPELTTIEQYEKMNPVIAEVIRIVGNYHWSTHRVIQKSYMIKIRKHGTPHKLNVYYSKNSNRNDLKLTVVYDDENTSTERRVDRRRFIEILQSF